MRWREAGAAAVDRQRGSPLLPAPNSASPQEPAVSAACYRVTAPRAARRAPPPPPPAEPPPPAPRRPGDAVTVGAPRCRGRSGRGRCVSARRTQGADGTGFSRTPSRTGKLLPHFAPLLRSARGAASPRPAPGAAARSFLRPLSSPLPGPAPPHHAGSRAACARPPLPAPARRARLSRPPAPPPPRAPRAPRRLAPPPPAGIHWLR